MTFAVTLACGIPGLADVLAVEADAELGGDGIVEFRPGYYRAQRDAAPGTHTIRWVRTDTATVLDEREVVVTGPPPVGGVRGHISIGRRRGSIHAR